MADALPENQLVTQGSALPRVLTADSAEWLDWGQDDEHGRQRRLQVLNSLSSMLNAEHLVVLTGLGSSLGMRTVPDDDDQTEVVGAPTMGTLLDKAKELPGFGAALELATEAEDKTNIERLLSRCLSKLSLTPDAQLSRFLSAAESMILEECGFVGDNTDLTAHEVFLRKVARRQARLARTQVFTTNYDLAFEEASKRIRFHAIDGFGLGIRHAFSGDSFDLDIVRRRGAEAPVLEPGAFHLFKLHGSVDWNEVDGEVYRVTDKPKAPVLIYPSTNKYQLSYRPPYFESISRLQIALRQSDVAVIVAGFGFNDAHIVAPIEAAIRSNIGLRLVVVDPGASESDNDTFKLLRSLITAGDRRLTLLQTTFAEFSSLLPDVSPQDEREIHERRTDTVWGTRA